MFLKVRKRTKHDAGTITPSSRWWVPAMGLVTGALLLVSGIAVADDHTGGINVTVGVEVQDDVLSISIANADVDFGALPLEGFGVVQGAGAPVVTNTGTVSIRPLVVRYSESAGAVASCDSGLWTTNGQPDTGADQFFMATKPESGLFTVLPNSTASGVNLRDQARLTPDASQAVELSIGMPTATTVGTSCSISLEVLAIAINEPDVELEILEGSALGTYLGYAALFGGEITTPASQELEEMEDLGCEPQVQFSLFDSAAVADRGGCTFTQKAIYAQEAGASLLIIINNVPGEPFAAGGSTGSEGVAIPVIMISQEDGTAIRAGGLPVLGIARPR